MNIKHALLYFRPDTSYRWELQLKITIWLQNQEISSKKRESICITLSALYSVSKLCSNNDLEQDYAYKEISNNLE